ncbi:MAG: RDD family protein, partial [Solirubrobacterales bacterium]
MSDEFFSAPQGAALAEGNPAPIWELSGWWRRVGAYFIDSFVIGVPAVILSEIVASGSTGDAFDVIAFLIIIAASTIYYMWTMAAWNGQTVGKKVTGIRVVREDGGRITAGYAFKRQTLVIGILFGYVAILLLYIPTFLNYLWPLWDEKNQALHDKIVKSRVVREQPSSDPGTFQAAQQQQAPFPVGSPPTPFTPDAPAVPPPPQAPPAPSAPPPPPP